ncbi:MAG: hypothetical protein WBP93_23705 [Pyrinomonadaceae bacterium]
MKIENLSQIKLPKKTPAFVEDVIESVPKEHLRGIDKVRLVDYISDPRLKSLSLKSEMPGLYHPRQGAQQAWLEVAVGAVLPQSKPFLKRLMPRLSYKGNLAAIIFSLVGQHYYLTLKHSVKKSQLEQSVRAYTEKRLRAWHERQHSFRARLFKPIQPTLERWSRTLQKRAKTEKKRGV